MNLVVSNEYIYLQNRINEFKAKKQAKLFYCVDIHDLKLFMGSQEEIDILNDDNFIVFFSEHFPYEEYLTKMYEKFWTKFKNFLNNPISLEGNDILFVFHAANRVDLEKSLAFGWIDNLLPHKNKIIKFFSPLDESSFKKFVIDTCKNLHIKISPDLDWFRFFDKCYFNRSHLCQDLKKIENGNLDNEFLNFLAIDYREEKIYTFMEKLVESKDIYEIYASYNELLKADQHHGWIFDSINTMLVEIMENYFTDKNIQKSNWKRRIANKLTPERAKLIAGGLYKIYANTLNNPQSSEHVSFIVEMLGNGNIK